MSLGGSLPVVRYASVLASEASDGIGALTEFSTVSVLIALLALTLVVAIGFGVFLFGFVRLIARR